MHFSVQPCYPNTLTLDKTGGLLRSRTPNLSVTTVFKTARRPTQRNNPKLAGSPGFEPGRDFKPVPVSNRLHSSTLPCSHSGEASGIRIYDLPPNSLTAMDPKMAPTCREYRPGPEAGEASRGDATLWIGRVQ